MAQNKKTENNTKNFVEIQDIREGIIILKNGTMQSVVEVSSVNFELKSEDEQAALISAFQEFLNASDFPIQIVIKSRKLDITEYIKNLDSYVENLDNELLRIQAVEYKRFVSGLTELANIMSKSFYIVAPLHLVESSASSKGIMSSITSVFKPSTVIKNISDEDFLNYKNQIMQRVDLVTSGLMGMGLTPRLLDDSELKEMLLSHYNG